MKYKRRFRVIVKCSPDFIFFAPSKKAAKVFTEMCGFVVISIEAEG